MNAVHQLIFDFLFIHSIVFGLTRYFLLPKQPISTFLQIKKYSLGSSAEAEIAN